MTTVHAHPSASKLPASISAVDRAWFLRRGCRWHDTVWYLAPTNALDEARSVQLHWNFPLPSGRRFTDEPYTSLLDSARQLVALIRVRSLSTGLPQRASTVGGYFMYLRVLLRWMDREGFMRFADLDAQAVMRFQCAIRSRTAANGKNLAPTTVQKYLYLLAYLYRFRRELDDALQIDPFPGQSAGGIAQVREGERPRMPYTPEHVAVALVQGAIEFLSHAPGILHARDVYAESVSRSRARHLSPVTASGLATRALQEWQADAGGKAPPILSTIDLERQIDMLYAACFVVISYLVGLRVSEILHLQAGCVEYRCRDAGDGGQAITVIVGTIFKREAHYHGRRHEWVAPPVAAQAIEILETLSAGHRSRSKRNDLWLRRRDSGVTEWQPDFPGELALPGSGRMCHLLMRFSRWLNLPGHEGKPWRLTTHQGRKTFSRFVALRDRSALFALAQQLGHRERAVTDTSYAGTDYRLNEEIDSAILQQSVNAWEYMLSTPALGGRAGAEIVARRPHFKGATLKEDIRSYARMLVDAGLVLGVCDWGFCVYREGHSACLGNAAGPNPARREPSTCARCRNFSVSVQHRPYWVGQIARHEALLDEPALPIQTLRIVRVRIAEARAMINAIDGNKDDADEQHFNG
jgi:integrase